MQSEKRPLSRVHAPAAFGHPAQHRFRFAPFFEYKAFLKTSALPGARGKPETGHVCGACSDRKAKKTEPNS
jgi:hypothetical protein